MDDPACEVLEAVCSTGSWPPSLPHRVGSRGAASTP